MKRPLVLGLVLAVSFVALTAPVTAQSSDEEVDPYRLLTEIQAAFEIAEPAEIPVVVIANDFVGLLPPGLEELVAEGVRTGSASAYTVNTRTGATIWASRNVRVAHDSSDEPVRPRRSGKLTRAELLEATELMGGAEIGTDAAYSAVVCTVVTSGVYLYGSRGVGAWAYQTCSDPGIKSWSPYTSIQRAAYWWYGTIADARGPWVASGASWAGANASSGCQNTRNYWRQQSKSNWWDGFRLSGSQYYYTYAGRLYC